MQKISTLLLLSFLLFACEKTEVTNEMELRENQEEPSDKQEEAENLVLLRTESKTEREGFEPGYYNVDLTYNSEGNLSNYHLEVPDVTSLSTPISYTGDRLAQIGDFSVTYGENQITLGSDNKKEEYFLENGKIVKYRWYQLSGSSSEYSLVVTGEFTFDDDFENVIRFEQFDQNGELTAYGTYEYDTNRNPYASLHDVFNVSTDFNLDILSLNNENNVVRYEMHSKAHSEFEKSTGIITYSYNDLDYPTNLKLVLDGFSIESDFIYE